MRDRVVILTGAGISAESGVPTFRGSGGLWEGHRVEDVATPEAFERDRNLVQEFYNARRRFLLSGITPNEGHRALARLQREYQGEVVLVTQNIDDLHERGGFREVWHMHGELLKARCLACGGLQEVRDDLGGDSRCENCGVLGGLRPDVVWFGEMPYLMDEIERALSGCGVFLSIGTSGLVYPAAGFVELARSAGAETIEVNLDETGSSFRFHRVVRGKAGEVLPELVGELLR